MGQTAIGEDAGTMTAASAKTGRRSAAIAAAVILLTTLGFLYFPGHTYLHSDTQIYMPILERFWDPTLFGKDPVALRPHVSYTVYDEMALLLRRITGGEFYPVLAAQQIVYRALGLFGVFLMARAGQLSPLLSLLVASLYGLGATIAGPAVLVHEYEPVPRGFAGPLLMLAAGLAANNRWMWAGAACGVAFLYHPPTTLPFCVVYGLLAVWRGEGRRERLRGLLPIFGAMVLLWLLSRLQAGATEPQEFLGRVDPELEKLQRMRGSYNWISLWGAQWIRHYELLYVVSLAAYFRLRAFATGGLRFLLAGLPLVGLLTMPLSYLLLEQAKWSLIPQFQPARAVMFIVAVAVISAGICGVHAGRAGRTAESVAWFAVAFAAPLQTEVIQLLLPDLRQPLVQTRVAIALGLAICATLASRFELSRPRVAFGFWLAAVLLPFYLIPEVGKVRNYPNLDQPEVLELAAWARSGTGESAVFLFPDSGRELYPGIFRAHSLRTLYVDWKSGGQVNLLRRFAFDWWDRWEKAMAGKFDPNNLERYRALGIDYLVVKPANRIGGTAPVYENPKYVVYALR